MSGSARKLEEYDGMKTRQEILEAIVEGVDDERVLGYAGALNWTISASIFPMSAVIEHIIERAKAELAGEEE